MKIAICGSMSFAREMLEAKEELESMGHKADVPIDTEECVENPELTVDLEHCIRNNVVRDHYDKIEASDAVLILNHTKDGVEGYIGANTLIEMGIAHFLGKKIFLLNRVPDMRCGVEIQLMEPQLLGGDLKGLEGAE